MDNNWVIDNRATRHYEFFQHENGCASPQFSSPTPETLDAPHIHREFSNYWNNISQYMRFLCRKPYFILYKVPPRPHRCLGKGVISALRSCLLFAHSPAIGMILARSNISVLPFGHSAIHSYTKVVISPPPSRAAFIHLSDSTARG